MTTLERETAAPVTTLGHESAAPVTGAADFAMERDRQWTTSVPFMPSWIWQTNV